MRLEEKVKAIEAPATRQPDWFYHAFSYKENVFSDITTQGIKCHRLIPQKSRPSKTGFNGRHYISLSKAEMVGWNYSSYLNYEDYPAFIIKNVQVQKCSYAFETSLVDKTRWPFRHSSYRDEYQAYRFIGKEHIIGLRASILEWYRRNLLLYLMQLKEMILFMQSHNITLPIYDYTRAVGYNIHQINPSDYLEIYSKIEEELESKEKLYIHR